MAGKTIKLHCAFQDGGDGSYSIDLCNTRKEALSKLDKTEAELKAGSTYDDGAIVEIELELVEGELRLKKSVRIQID